MREPHNKGPFHFGHQSILREMLENHPHVTILIGKKPDIIGPWSPWPMEMGEDGPVVYLN